MFPFATSEVESHDTNLKFFVSKFRQVQDDVLGEGFLCRDNVDWIEFISYEKDFPVIVDNVWCAGIEVVNKERK